MEGLDIAGSRCARRLAGRRRIFFPVVARSSAAGWGGLVVLLLILLGAGAPAGAAADARRPVAMVYQQTITAGMLAPAEEGLASLKRRFGNALTRLWDREARRQALRRQIIHRLLLAYCAEQGLEASEAEIQDYLAYLRWLSRVRRARLVREEEELTARRQQSTLRAKDRLRLMQRLDHLGRMIIRLDEELEKEDKELSGTSQVDEAQRALAREQVLRWKGYRALYERYGGEVACDARGMVPVGAIRALVAERQSTYGVVILDPEYQDVLDDFSPPLVGMHFPVPRRQAEAYFAQPWWMTAMAGSLTDGGGIPSPDDD